MDGRCATLLAALTAAGTAWAAASPWPIDPSSIEARAPSPLLVLVDGQVIRGTLKSRPDGYEVTTRAGRTFIESARVRLLAADLTDAYQKLVASRVDATPESHVELARWCIANDLQAEAARELLDALRLDPQRGDARQLLRSIDPNALALAAGTAEAPSTEANGVERRFGRNDGATGVTHAAASTRSLAGLQRSIAQDFTRHVQPLLMSKCATTGCHGATSPSSFRLTSTHRGSTASVSEKNLAAVLQQLNAEDPAASPLLEFADTVHGDMTQPAFRGRVGTLQREVLIRWLEDVGEDLVPESSRRRSVENRQQAASESSDSGSSRQDRDFTGDDVPVHGSQRSRTVSDAQFIAETQRTLARDPFHPSRFNLRRHGRAAAASDPAPTQFRDTESAQSNDDRPVSGQPSYSEPKNSSLTNGTQIDQRVRP